MPAAHSAARHAIQVQRSAAHKTQRNVRMAPWEQMARDRLVIRGLLCSAWRAVTIPIYARGAQVADNRALISGCVGNYCQLIIVANTRVNDVTCDFTTAAKSTTNWE